MNALLENVHVNSANRAFAVCRKTRTLLMAMLTILASSCSETQFATIEVKSGDSIEQKLDIAKRVVTEERLARLKIELKEKHPKLTDADLSSMVLSWNNDRSWTVGAEKANRSVTVVVMMGSARQENSAQVVLTAGRILDAEINKGTGVIP